jgi:hypothetical protein
MSTVLGYLFLPTELLWDAGTTSSSTLLYYFWYPSSLICYLVLAGTTGTLQYLYSIVLWFGDLPMGCFVLGFH